MANFVHTAEIYASGHSEVVFGKALKELGWRRESYVISTKIYFGDGTSGPNDRVSDENCNASYLTFLGPLSQTHC